MLRAPKTPVIFRLVCVRHGETDANRESRIQGHIDIPLNALGLEQANKAGEALSGYVWSRAYSSDMQRAQQTAQAILRNSKANPPPLTVDSRIKEKGFGRFENMLIVDARKEMIQMKVTWPEYTPEGGETQGQVLTRMVNFFKTLCQSVYDKSSSVTGSQSGDSTEASANNSTDVTSNDTAKDSSAEQQHQGGGADLAQDTIREEDLSATVLLVSHGIALKILYNHLAKNLGCVIDGSLEEHSLNTGYSVFTVRYSPRRYEVTCQVYNKADHIKDIKQSSL